MNPVLAALPPEDRALSSLTGWGREHLEAAVDALVLAAQRWASPAGSLLTPPGRANLRSDRWCDGLEGYARVGLLVGARVAGAGGDDPHGFLERWAEGLAAGTDPAHPERWPTTDEHGQAKVEAAAVAVLLEQTRPWLWDRLDAGVQERVVAWFARVVGTRYPPTNWLWFRLVAETFLASVGGPWSAGDVAEDLALHETFVREHGWHADGPGRSFDHYSGWALHLYALRERYAARLHDWLADAVLLVGSGSSGDDAGDDGGAVPLLQGRSLTYRFAAAGPFWVGALEGCTPLAPGLTRRVGVGMVRHFLLGGSLSADGTLPLGWQGEFLPLVQPYSGSASPYWAAKGALGLLLPADHAVWTAVEEPLPVERADTAAALRSPGWLVSGTRADGVVRVLNHGTDHAEAGAVTPDDPLYARLGYSTATAPDVGPAAAADPLDGAVTVLDASGRASHRTGFRCLEVRADGTGGGDGSVVVGVSQGRVHVHDDVPEGCHSDPPPGPGAPGPWLTVASAVRGPLEVRLARVDTVDGAPDDGSDDGGDGGLRLRVGGWAVAHGQSLRSAVVPLRGLAERGATAREGASALGPTSTTPWAAGPAGGGEVVAALVVLTGDPAVDAEVSAREVAVEVTDRRGGGHGAVVTWPGGTTTAVALPPPPAAGGSCRGGAGGGQRG